MFPPSLRKMLETQRVQGRTRELGFVGGSTENNLFVLTNYLDKHKPARTLEVGLACGASALAFTHMHRLIGGDTERVHVAIDPFQADLDDAALVQIEDEGLDSYFRFIRKPSYAALPKMLREGLTFDMIYIDGSHHFDHVFIDIFYSARLLSKGGIVLFDDSTLPEVRKVISFVRRNWMHAFSETDLAEYRRDSGRSWRYRVAKALGRVQLTGFRKNADPERSAESSFKSF